MISYVKGNAPRCLGLAAKEPDAVWDPAPPWLDKSEIREALVRDQRGLCAYCERRIKAEFHNTKGKRPEDIYNHDRSTKIEHWHAGGDGGPHFEWRNLLGVCKGRFAEYERGPVRVVKTCDTARRDATNLTLHPVRGRGKDP